MENSIPPHTSFQNQIGSPPPKPATRAFLSAAELSLERQDVEELGGVKRKRYKCRFVRSGMTRGVAGSVGNIEVTAPALSAAVSAGMFDRCAVFLDHSTGFPSVRNLVGYTSKSTYNEIDGCVDGVIELIPGVGDHAGDLFDYMSMAQDGPNIGLSIVFYPEFDTSNRRQVRSIRYVESVDLVFEPAADGRILQALSIGGIEMEEKAEYNAAPERDIEDDANRLSAAAWSSAAEKSAVKLVLDASGLPAVSKDRLSAGTYANPQALQAAIEAERDYLAKLEEMNTVKLGGTAPRGGGIQVGLDGKDQITLALEALMLGTTPAHGVRPLTGIREAYIALSGDYEMTGVFHPERVQFSNVDSSSMAGLVANALNKSVVNMFQQYPRWWEKFTFAEDFANLQQVKWITLGGVGDLPTVGEGAAYTELTWDDQTETASFVKKGGYLGITLEAIDKDDTRKLQAAPRALAQSAWLTLSKAVSNVFTQSSGVGPTMSDSQALFHTNHGNLGTTALSITSYAAARLAMRKQTELNSSERLGALTAPKYLLVPPDLEITALQVLASENDYTYAVANAPAGPVNALTEGNSLSARMAYAKDRVIVVDLWTDTNNWAAIADPMMYPSVGVGYRYGRTPEIFSVASPTAGLMFTNDVMPIKVRYFFAVGPTDWRGMYKANVA